MAKDPLRWGILGAAAIARRAIVPAIQSAGDMVVAVGTTHVEKGNTFARDFGIETVYDSYQAVVDDPRIEAVYIPLPNHLHYPWTVAAARAGKHILCEKPLALNVAQAEEMLTKCRGAGVVLAEAVFFRHHPRLALLKQMLDEGMIGSVRHLSFSFSFHLPDGPNIRWEPGLGGGVLYDTGSHGISLIRFLLDKEPLQVSAVMHKRHGVDVTTAASLLFPDDATASVYVSFNAGDQQSLTLIGTTGLMRVPRPIATWMVGGPVPGPARPFILERNGEETVMPTPAPINAYEEMVKSFKRSVRSGDPVFLRAEDGIANLRVIEACQTSSSSGRPEVLSSP
ncbi:MAG TPA: Gfo/Idh/MocA family oxidoreductase [bacterium]|nr:Gfo/Idh/MocA family oxidoreductase [bacterium]